VTHQNPAYYRCSGLVWTEYFPARGKPGGRNPWRWGAFSFDYRTLQEISTRVRIPSPAAQPLRGAMAGAADPRALGSSFVPVGQRLRHGSCGATRLIVESATRWPIGEPANASSSSTRQRPVMWNSNLVFRSGHESSSARPRADRVDPDCRAALWCAWAVRLHAGAKAAARLAHRSVHGCPRTGCRRITGRIAGQPHQAVCCSVA